MKDQRVSWKYIQQLPTELGQFKGDLKLKVLKENLSDIHPADLADIIEELDYEQRAAVLNQIDAKQASETLEEIDPNVQRDIAKLLPMEKITQLLSMMTAGQIADILSALPRMQAQIIVKTLEKSKAKKVTALMEKQEEGILNLAMSKIITCPPIMTVAEAQNTYQKLAKGKIVVMYLYITTNEGNLLGVLDIKELLEADDTALLREIMKDNVITLTAESTYKQAADMFARYDFRAIPVIDLHKILIGAVTYKDLMGLKHRFIE